MPRSTSVWLETEDAGKGIPLRRSVRADVCVVGAGIAGLTTAYLPTRENASVVVIDSGRQGSGQTSVTTAHLSNEIDDTYKKIQRLHGPDGARLACESHREAIERIEAICHLEHLHCDFRRVDGFLFVGAGQDVSELHEEFDAALAAGVARLHVGLPLSWLALRPLR